MQDKYILYNGKIYTDILRGDYEEALLVTGDTIGCVGTLQLCHEADASGAEEIDIEGKHVLPAFLDGHTHPVLVARSNWHVIMPAEKNKEKLLQNIKEAAEAVPKEEMPYFFADAYYSETFGDRGFRICCTLAAGRKACLMSMDEDFLERSPQALAQTAPCGVIFDGRPVVDWTAQEHDHAE